eukprot:TRINITY_DN9798_c0_g1_i7.p1 TRINITY_DN9798_c0_g1~~TRINITY_DN9798_c0_g1_i7.p1  ORF type:complete len:497 (+),score=114.61 TRINITY_DN9798_c0_g1_i7:128-1618(+)
MDDFPESPKLPPSESVQLRREPEPGPSEWVRHFGAVVSKRAAQATRDVRSAVFVFVVPVAAVLFGLVFVTVLGSKLNQAALRLSFKDAFLEPSTLTVPYSGALSQKALDAFHAAMPQAKLVPESALSHQAPVGSLLPCANASTFGKPWFASEVLRAVPSASLGDVSSLRLTLGAAAANCIYDRFCCIQASPGTEPGSRENTTKPRQDSCPRPELAVTSYCEAEGPEGESLRSILVLDEHLLEVTAEPGQKLRHFGAAAFSDGGLSNYTVLHNTAAPHALPTWINGFDAAALKLADPDQSISASTHPWPLTSRQKVRFELAAGLLVSLLITMGLSFVPAAFASYIVKERESKVLHQQQVSGLSVSSYFVANLVWDLMTFMVAMLLILMLFFVFATYAPAYTHHLAETVMVFLLYGLSSCAFAYALSHCFASYSSATVGMLMLNIVTGLLFMITSFILQSIDEDTKAVNSVLVYIFYLSPSFCLGNSLLAIFAVYRQG